MVQRDDGQKITVAQRDDGDVQLGDRVQIVQDRQGVAKVVRDTSREPGLSLAFIDRRSCEEDVRPMFGKWLFSLLVPLALAAGLGACNGSSGAVQPGVVNTSARRASYRGETGRVMAIREVPVRGSSGSGVSDGTLIGGGLGAAGGAAIGAATTNSVGGAVVGGLLGAVGGAIAGTAIDRGSRPGAASR